MKTAAYDVGSASWGLYVLAFLIVVLLLLPGGLLAAVLIGGALTRSQVGTRKAFVHLAQALVPLGLAAWIAFSLSFVFANVSYVWPVISDPLGWGWNVLGTVGIPWSPYLGGMVPILQVGVLLGGLGWSVIAARRIAGQVDAMAKPAVADGARRALPVIVYCLAVTLVLLGLLVG